MGERRPERSQLGGTAEHPVHEEAVDDGVEAERQFDKILDELVRNRAAEAIAPTFRIESQQMVAVFGGFADPKLADRTAIDKDIVHSGSPDIFGRPSTHPSRFLVQRAVLPCESLAILRCTIRLTT